MKRLLYYEKPRLGGLSNQRSPSQIPTQIVMPNGEVLLGSSFGAKPVHTPNSTSSGLNSIIVSWHDTVIEMDRRLKSTIILALLVIVNMAIGISLISRTVVDSSQVERSRKNSLEVGGLPQPFDFHSEQSTGKNWPEFMFLMLRSILCLVACLDQSPTGLSLYILSTMVCFILFATSIPSIIFAGRYLFDLATCYVAFGIRNGMMLNWLCPPPQSQ